jgi:hypothetical protein
MLVLTVPVEVPVELPPPPPPPHVANETKNARAPKSRANEVKLKDPVFFMIISSNAEVAKTSQYSNRQIIYQSPYFYNHMILNSY